MCGTTFLPAHRQSVAVRPHVVITTFCNLFAFHGGNVGSNPTGDFILRKPYA